MSDKKNTLEQNVPTQEGDVPKVYTEEQMREIYNEGQQSGYIAAIKNIRSNINDYLDSLIIAASMQNKGK